MGVLTSPTLGKLIFNVRNMLSEPNSVNSKWTDAELTEYLNEAVRLYFAEVIANSEGYFTVTTDPLTNLDITSGTEAVALPSDFFQCKALYIQRNTGWELLEYRNNITSGFSTMGGTGGNTYSPYYFFMGNNIILHPTPQYSATGALRLDYVQFPSTMINGGDALTNQVSPVFKHVIEKYAIVQAKKKQSLVSGADVGVSIAQADLNESYSNFKNAINKRSVAPEYVVPFNPEGNCW